MALPPAPPRPPRSRGGVFLEKLLLAGLLLAAPVAAQQAPANGPTPRSPQWHALVRCTAVTSPGVVVQDATIVLRDGRITAVGAEAAPPEGARIWDCSGLTVYAGFVEPYHAIEAPAPDPKAPGSHWSPKIVPQRHVLTGEGLPESVREEFRKLGFGAERLVPLVHVS